MSRVLDVVRMHLLVRLTFVTLPLIILGGAFLVTLGVFALIPSDGVKIAGSGQAALWYFLSVGAMAQTRTFPFSQAMSVTRRDFLLGTMLTGLLSSGVLAALYVVLGLIENATGGWGVNGRIYFIDDFGGGNVAVAFLAYLVIAMLAFTIGLTFATIYKRFKLLGLWAAIAGVLVVLLVTVIAITRADAWPTVAELVSDAGPLGLSAIGAVVIAVLGFVDLRVLRRTQP
ncbi:hypothetical protein [Pseudactinotalea suaedae]|jgi:hypothetical protein|uniref:hypothetical protein n=1 Tax=Pseudactinotalea suaedae TaxID=1524924 RepID=UPI0012E2FF86|nr:hypothetical protein [Pseudactinotalea suaedae]